MSLTVNNYSAPAAIIAAETSEPSTPVTQPTSKPYVSEAIDTSAVPKDYPTDMARFDRSDQAIEQPGQPSIGYGSTENYKYDTVAPITFGNQFKGEKVSTFVPELKEGEKAPVVVFLHGMSMNNPSFYKDQIDHLVKQGNIVIFPHFNKDGMGMMADMNQYAMLDRAIDGVNKALELDEVKNVADKSNITLVGHSVGGMLALGWADRGGVEVKNMVLMHPNVSERGIPAFVRPFVKSLDYESMAEATTAPVTIIGGEDDQFVFREDLESVFNALENASSKAYYEVKTDTHGNEDLNADHMAPAQDSGWIPDWAMGPFGGDLEENALDYRVYYAAVDAALDDQTRMNFDMGKWSDGTDVKPVELIMES